MNNHLCTLILCTICMFTAHTMQNFKEHKVSADAKATAATETKQIAADALSLDNEFEDQLLKATGLPYTVQKIIKQYIYDRCENYAATTELQISPDSIHLKNVAASLLNGLIITGSYYDNNVRVWDQATGVCLKRFEGHTGRIPVVTALPNNLIASGSRDKTVRIWDSATGKCLHVLQGHTRTIYTIMMVGENILTVGCNEPIARLWNYNTGELVRTIESKSPIYHVCQRGYFNNSLILVSYEDGSAAMLDLGTGEQHALPFDCTKKIFLVDFIPLFENGRKFIVSFMDGTLEIYGADNAYEGPLVRLCSEISPENPAYAIEYGKPHNSDAKMDHQQNILMQAHFCDGKRQGWDLETYKCLYTFPNSDTSVTSWCGKVQIHYSGHVLLWNPIDRCYMQLSDNDTTTDYVRMNHVQSQYYEIGLTTNSARKAFHALTLHDYLKLTKLQIKLRVNSYLKEEGLTEGESPLLDRDEMLFFKQLPEPIKKCLGSHFPALNEEFPE